MARMPFGRPRPRRRPGGGTLIAGLSISVSPSALYVGGAFTVTVTVPAGGTLSTVTATAGGTPITLTGSGNTRTGTAPAEAGPLVVTATGADADGNPLTANRTVQVREEPVAPTAPGQFSASDWSVTTGLAASQVVLNVSALPSDGGSPITVLQYSVDGGDTWTALSGTGTGSRTLTMPAAGTSYTFALRAVNAVGAGAASASKSATSGASAGVTASISGLSASGKATTGVTLTGQVSGVTGAPTIEHRWFVGVAQVGNAQSYTPIIGEEPIQDGVMLTYAPLIGGVEVSSPVAIVAHAAPTASGTVPAISAVEGEGLFLVPTSSYFSGEGLVYSISGGGSIDASTGQVSFLAAGITSGTMTVTATNSGGSATRTINYAVGPLVLGDITTQEITLLSGTPAGAPATYPLADTVGATGVLIVVATTAAAPNVSVTVGGEEAKLVGLVNAATNAGAAANSARVFYADKSSGDVIVSGAPATADHVVKAYPIVGGKLRSFDITNWDGIPASGSSSNAVSVAVDAKEKSLSFAVILGDGARVISPAHTAGTAWTLASGSNAGSVQWATFPAEADDTTISFNSNTYRTRLGFGVLVASQIPVTQVTVSDPPAEGYVYPLNAALTSASIPVTVQHTAADGVVQARVVSGATVVSDWASIGTSVNGSVTGAVSVTKAAAGMKQLKVEARLTSDPSATGVQLSSWYAGIVVAGYGQSNWMSMLQYSLGVQTCPWPTGAIVAGSGGGYSRINNSGLAKFATDLIALSGCPVMIITGGISGASIGLLTPNGNEFPNLAAMVAKAGRLHGFLWHQGEGDVASSTNEATYITRLTSIRDGLAAAANMAPADLPIITSSLLTYGATSEGVSTHARWSMYDDILRRVETASLISNGHWAGSCKDVNRLDTYHGYRGGSMRRGARYARKVAEVLGFATAHVPFKVSSASIASATTTTVTLSHGLGTDFAFWDIPHLDPAIDTPQSAAAGGMWEVSADGTTWITATAARAGASSLTLTHASLGTSARYIRYLYGFATTTNGIIIDNSGIAEPLDHLSSMACAA
ncbi:sialate O-acetylesterase [Paenirhodobacter populi]|uniref:sialate O-acetylesterase n=1 Tax=Paenirhodobacter populi TaxID=2306993 RepID=UPI000FE3CA4C|nr:sialate O-acetylesterase [Sinirhodobacter populi]RWR09821.1 hypothetical protein D2T32_05630 [Sinirhodobacter populi]